MLRMLMFGKPGAGKGTLTSRLLQTHDISLVPCGDILRQHIKDKTAVGRSAEKIMASGELVPDGLITGIIIDRLKSLKNPNWMMDGFPRTVRQGEMLDDHLGKMGIPLTLVVILDVADDIIIDRISNRWIHQPSGRIYNLSYNRPRVDGKDDITDEPLTRRQDDNPEIFKRRLRNYYQSTMPLVSYFQSRQNAHFKVVSLTGKTSDEIWPHLLATVNGKCHIRASA